MGVIATLAHNGNPLFLCHTKIVTEIRKLITHNQLFLWSAIFELIMKISFIKYDE